MKEVSVSELLAKIRELESRLEESEYLSEAIRVGDVDAFAIRRNDTSEIYTLESSDYAYRILIEESGEGAINVTEEGLIVYTNPAFCQLLELPYEKVIGHSIYDFIDPESLSTFNSIFNRALSGKAKEEINLRTNTREIPVYLSLTSLQPQLSTVGIIISDISDKKRHESDIAAYQKRLESRNSTLIKMNTELQSFAHISSHDLQEPLRKIQIITSRIIEEESKNLSETGMDLFRRMRNSAKRMQLVIDDLLAYSTTNSDKLKAEDTDLNKIIEELKEEFSDDIEKKKASIISNNLGNLKIIPLHIRQVLQNLISNSLKFARVNTPCIININYTVGKGSELSEDKDLDGDRLLPDMNYCHISYCDNGIGFDPVYKERIFGLFQRLHPKDQYKGTGIGLAIVKKIIDSHNGIIVANGEPDKGATFDIFLPQ